jgi:uncharacterized cupredoxin-like copper-binding protein
MNQQQSRTMGGELLECVQHGEILVHRRGEFVVSATRIAEVAVEPGKKVTLTFTPTRKGTFEIACQLSTGGGGSHAKAGMVGTLVVK